MISLKKASYTFHGIEVLHDIQLLIQDEEHWAIYGSMASGKSMLLRALAGQIHPIDGSINFSFKDVHVDAYEVYKSVELVSFTEKNKYFNSQNHYYQQRFESLEDEFSKSITVSEFLRENESDQESGLIELLPHLRVEEIMDRKLIQLSSGQRRKLMLVNAIKKQPEILILDDPYIGLDAASRLDLNSTLNALASQNMQLIIAGKPDDMPSCIENNLDLDNGSVIYSGKLKLPKPQNNKFAIPEPIINRENPPAKFKTLVKFDGVNVRYGSTSILQNINWALHKGERVAILGNNGSGKSTMLSLMYGDNPQAYANPITLFDRLRGTGESIWDIKKQIGFVSPELHLYFTPSMPGLKVIGTGFFEALTISRKLTESQSDLIHVFAEYFKIEHVLERLFGQLSVGEQRLLLFIRAIISSRPLILLDEPYQGMDTKSIAKANHLLDHLLKGNEISLLFITHYEHELPTCITRKTFLEEGSIVKDVSREVLKL